jgi:spore germination cell wall hydrolase CwlJ-like protein
MNLDARTLILTASLMASAPMNPVSANPAHDSPNPVVQDEDLDNSPNLAKGEGDGPLPKNNRVETKKQRALKPKPSKGSKSPDAELQCLALNIYHEAGAEPYIGKQAVAAVTLNRVKSSAFPTSVCGVVKQRNQKSCQFSWVCQRPNAQPEKDSDAWQDALEIARKTLKGQHQDPTHGALYFHATRVKPHWSRVHKKTTRIGGHIFYKPAKKAA